jgi:multidrug efflux pump subunit AcrB
LLTIPIRLSNSKHVPLGTLAEIDFAPGFGALNRTNRMGVITLHIQLTDASSQNLEAIHQDLATHFFPMLKQQYPGIITRGDEAEEADEIMENLKLNTLIALMAIYALLAISFKSYAQPLLFLLAIPFAWLGAVLAHWAVGLNFSFQSLIGMVAASGVVINDSVVLLHFIQRKRAEGSNLTKLIVDACIARFRSILLVALTSIAGFAPMLFETSEQAKFLVPVTLSLAASLSFGMVATLVLVPICYAVFADFHTFFSKRSQAFTSFSQDD